MMQAVHTYEMSVNSNKTKRHYIPKGSHLHLCTNTVQATYIVVLWHYSSYLSLDLLCAEVS
jgi:hypothetical protein